MNKRKKHNKKRNTAFLYESLIKEYTKVCLSDDTERKTITLSLIKEHFKKGTQLYSELKIYQSLLETRGVEEDFAERILAEAKEVHRSSINKNKLFEEQSALISKINKSLSKEVYNNFASNYKSLASIAQIFNDDFKISKKMLLENSLVKQMSSQEEESEMKPISNLVFKTFTGNFNKEYSNLLSEQKTLISHFVFTDFSDPTQFKIFLNEEIQRLKTNIAGSLDLSEIQEDQYMKEKTEKVISKLNEMKERPVDREMVINILKIQQLSSEVQK
jgi:hypothetical protein